VEILTDKQGGEKVLDGSDDALERYLPIHMKKFISFVLFPALLLIIRL